MLLAVTLPSRRLWRTDGRRWHEPQTRKAAYSPIQEQAESGIRVEEREGGGILGPRSAWLLFGGGGVAGTAGGCAKSGNTVVGLLYSLLTSSKEISIQTREETRRPSVGRERKYAPTYHGRRRQGQPAGILGSTEQATKRKETNSKPSTHERRGRSPRRNNQENNETPRRFRAHQRFSSVCVYRRGQEGRRLRPEEDRIKLTAGGCLCN